MVVGFTVTGMKETKQYLKFQGMLLDTQIQDGLRKSGEFLKREVKASIKGERAEPRSVDTGDFFRSVTFRQTKEEVSIFTPVLYSKYLEYGTSRIAARKHFDNTKNRNIMVIKKMIEDSLKLGHLPKICEGRYGW